MLRTRFPITLVPQIDVKPFVGFQTEVKFTCVVQDPLSNIFIPVHSPD